ncbi:hypothetical protein PCH_Pc16g03720 [Penicillium rubens Wisconsin 54-1255]|uniref:Uncharacterized protein n=1 Tax=Penicillium rubens (strain ATCC 28089 / DSM 1075 / NRRL 1951 / Wisconsin 54-1255) TaxID=500485 RepID=B6H7T7_PENRW|nr:hypothetical protein PCH_Pc16g03720 [Penicillium rubens Wisconsin 54-1255]
MGIFEDHDSSLRLGTFGSFAEVIGGVNTRPNSLSECDLQGVDGGLRRPAAPAAVLLEVMIPLAALRSSLFDIWVQVRGDARQQARAGRNYTALLVRSTDSYHMRGHCSSGNCRTTAGRLLPQSESGLIRHLRRGYRYARRVACQGQGSNRTPQRFPRESLEETVGPRRGEVGLNALVTEEGDAIVSFSVDSECSDLVA